MAAEPLTPRLRPLGVGEILDVGIKIYTRNWLTLWKIVIFVVLPAQILVNVVTVSAVSGRHGIIVERFPNGTRTIDTHDLAVVLVGGLLGAFIGYMAGVLAQAACFRAVADAYLGEPVNWRSSLGFALRRLPALIVLSFATSIFIAAGFLLCIIPGVYLWGAVFVAVPVLLVEGSGPFASIGRSRRLVKGRWWPTVGVAVVGTLLVGIVSSVLSTVLVGLVFASTNVNTVTGFILHTLASTIASVLTLPAAAAFATVLYIDLRVRKEGFDLLLLARGLGSESAPTGALPSFLPPSYLPPAPASSQPPYWPPPPGWTPDPAPDPVWDPAPEPSPGLEQPPFWPPPPGWQPGDK